MFEQLRRDLADALSRTGGMRVGLPKVTVDCQHLQHLIDKYDILQSENIKLKEVAASAQKLHDAYIQPGAERWTLRENLGAALLEVAAK